MDRMLVHGRVDLSIKFAGTHAYIDLGRERRYESKVCLAQKHKATSSVRA